MYSTNRRLAASMATIAGLVTVQAAPAPPPVDDALKPKDLDDDQEKELINELADEWASDNEDKSGDEALPLDDQQDVNGLSVDNAEDDEILDTEENGEEVNFEPSTDVEGDISTSELDLETQALEEIAKTVENDVYISANDIDQGDEQEFTIEIEETQPGEYDVTQESFDEAAIETESESKDDDSWLEQGEKTEEVLDIKELDVEEPEEVTWDTEPDSEEEPSAADEEKNMMENDKLDEAKDDIDQDTLLTTVEDESFAEEFPTDAVDIEMSIDEEENLMSKETDTEESRLDDESEMDIVYTTTEVDEGAYVSPDFFADETTATLDDPVVDTDIQDQIDSVLDNVQETMDETPDAIKPPNGIQKEPETPEVPVMPHGSKTTFSNAEGTDPFNPVDRPSIDSLEEESNSSSLNLLLLFAIIVFLAFKSPKIKRYIFSRDSGSLPYHAVGRKSRD